MGQAVEAPMSAIFGPAAAQWMCVDVGGVVPAVGVAPKFGTYTPVYPACVVLRTG